MNQPKYLQHLLNLGLIVIFLAGCGIPAAAPTPTSVPPTDTTAPTPVPPTETTVPSPIPPTETPIPLPTSVPGTKFKVTTEGVVLMLLVPWCNLTKIGRGSFTTEGTVDDVKSMMDYSNNLFAPGDPTILPNPGDDVLCYIKGWVYEGGSVTNAQLKSWVAGGKVYLLNRGGKKSTLVFAGVIEAEQYILMLFSAPREFSPAQLQLSDTLVDLP
jgi:hypothetical protein